MIGAPNQYATPLRRDMPRRYAKAIVAALSGFAVPFLGALTESSDKGSSLTAGEWATAIIGALIAGLTVYAAPNKPPKGEAADPRISEQGVALVELLLIVVLVLVAIWLVAALV
jgi:hypothetical protein